MANYTPTFTKPYPNGWVDKPSKTTPATAAIMNSYDTAIAALESYLRDNAIKNVSADTTVKSGTKIATITIDGTEYVLYSPNVSYESAITGGTKVGTITVGANTFDVYAPTSSTGGSTVSVVPKTLTGTNIAEITVDGNTYQLYAPTSGGGGSTVTAEATLTEGTQIGKITIDGVETILYAPTASPITVDSELSATSENAIQNKAVDAAVKNLQQQIDAGGAGGSVTVDSALSTTSVNPVQNKVVTAELNKKIETLNDESQAPDVVNFDLDSELSLTSVKGVQNKAIAEEFQKYANGTKVVAKATEANTATTASNAEKVNGHTVGADVPSNAVFTDTVYDDSTVKSSIQNIVNGTTQVGKATKATQDAQGNVIDTTYAKKTEVPQGTVVDDALSSTSTNPVQNKVVKAEFDQVNSNLDGLGYGENGAYNILDLSKLKTLGFSIEEGNITNVITDTRTSFDLYIMFEKKDGTYINSVTERNLQNKSKDFTFSIPSGSKKMSIKHNGASNDIYIAVFNISDFGLKENDTITVHISVSSGNPTVVGGIVINELAIVKGSTFTGYKPYIPSVKMLAEEVNQQKNDLSNLKDGTTPAAKAVADEDGNNIKSTYAKKTEAFETVTEDVNVVLNSDLFDSTYSDITCVRIGKLCVLSFTIRVQNTISSTVDKIVLMTIVGTKYQPKKLGAGTGRRQIFQGFAVGNYDENGKQSQSLNNTVRIITSSYDNYTEIITRDKDRINWNGYVQGQIMWVTD